MRTVYLTILAAHIAAALFSVITFWIPAFARKGSPIHVRAGNCYVRGMSVMAVTALLLCALNLADPVGMGSTEEARQRRAIMGADSSQDTEAFLVERVWLNATWLAYLAVLLLAGVRFGTRVVQTRQNHDTLRTPVETGISGALVVSGLLMLAFGLSENHAMITTFGTFGVLDGSRRIAFMWRPSPSRMAWWLQHMGAMLATGLPLHAALLLAVGRHLPGPPGSWRLLPTTLTLLGLPAIVLWKRYYRHRFEPRRRSTGPEATAGSARAAQTA